MTEKRFTTVELPKPNKWGIWYDGAYLSTYQVCILLNEYVDVKKENEQLKSALKELKTIGDYQSNRIQELNDENNQLHQSIADWETSFDLLKQQLQSEHQMLENAILLERTRMGQNALKQYKEAIQ